MEQVKWTQRNEWSRMSKPKTHKLRVTLQTASSSSQILNDHVYSSHGPITRVLQVGTNSFLRSLPLSINCMIIPFYSENNFQLETSVNEFFFFFLIFFQFLKKKFNEIFFKFKSPSTNWIELNIFIKLINIKTLWVKSLTKLRLR